MASHYVDIMLAELAVPGEQLVEGVALSAIVVLLQQTAGSSLVAMIHVHIAHAETAVVVHTEVHREFDALQPSGFSFISAQYDTGTQTGSVALVLGLVVHQASQGVVVVVGAGALRGVVTIVEHGIAILVEHAVTIGILDVHREQGRYELSRVPHVGCRTAVIVAEV